MRPLLKASPVTANTSMNIDSTTLSASEQSGAEQIATLLDQMRSKDALVAQLTEGLEAAAEQLDRMQRSGADRRHPSGPGGSSRELVEQTGQLTSRVEDALESWGQASRHYDVILQRLNEISSYLTNPTDVRESSPAPKAATGLFQAPASSTSATAPSASPPATSGAEAGPGQGTFWEKMKASMIDGTPPPTRPNSQTAAPQTAAPQTASTRSNEPAANISENGPDSIDPIDRISPPPVAIDLNTASIEELREAVSMRDDYISTLISELRSADSLPQLPQDLLQSGLGPQELLASLVELESRLKTGVQRENLELSLEKARMARERQRLDQVKTQLEGHIKRMSAPPVEKVEEPPPEPGTRNMSWLKRVTGK